jgi:7-carboxy-7-deazaguanine synthase
MLASNTLKINEIFRSFQGEGLNAGREAVFVRFSGCNRSCSFCDTEHESFREMTVNEIIDEIFALWREPDYVIFTGGEPTIQAYEDLYDSLRDDGGIEIAIESNGMKKLNRPFDWITISPKDLQAEHDWGEELKIVYTGKEDPSEYYRVYPNFNYYFLQPCSNRNIPETLEAIRKNKGWRLSLQWQKLINIK